MSGFDSARIYSTAVLPPETTTEATNKDIQNTLVRFIEEFRIDNVFLYRDQLRENVLISLFNLQVDMMHLNSFDSDIWQRMMKEPAEVLPLFESAIRRVATRIMYGIDFGKTTNNAQAQLQDQPRQGNKMAPPCQLLLRSDVDLTLIRTLDAGYMSKLVRLPGIVIGASTLSSKATLLHLMCRSCRSTIDIPVTGGFAGVTFPRDCRAPAIEGQPKECGLDPYVIVHEKSMFIDQQTLKLQEAPDQVPVGELPRHIVLNADRYLTNKVVPGSRCTVMGIYSVYQNKTSKKTGAIAIRNPYLRVLGIQVDANNHTKMEANFTDEEEEEFLNLSRNPNLYEIFANSIAPSIYGNADIKRAVACLLLGGSKKILPDSMKLRGDINVLLLGDPGTAKSQILKFVEKVAPIAIYTSGKGSSAAGLTASVQRDAITREFFLEGGAMVLADGGVVCIDEFDKMRDEDRVAIHEAMEQQTISIAKAGITTILNSRTSVLAAANPIFGRYDDMKSPGDNIDFQTTILSRFDMIFIVKDDHNEARDQSIARHVMNIHMNRINADTHEGGEISIEKMKRYIAYCKA